MRVLQYEATINYGAMFADLSMQWERYITGLGPYMQIVKPWRSSPVMLDFARLAKQRSSNGEAAFGGQRLWLCHLLNIWEFFYFCCRHFDVSCKVPVVTDGTE